MTVVPSSDGRPKASHARYQHMAWRPKTEARASNGTPHCRRERAFSTSSVRAIMEGMTNDGRRAKTAPVALHFAPAHDQVLFDRHVGIVQGASLVHIFGKQFRVLAQHLGQILPILGWVVHIRAILGCTWARETEMLRAHGWCSVLPCCAGLVSTQYGEIRRTILLIFRLSPLTTKSGGIREFKHLKTLNMLKIIITGGQSGHMMALHKGSIYGVQQEATGHRRSAGPPC